MVGHVRTPQYRHFATYYNFLLPFLGSNGHQLTNQHKILVLPFLSTSTFMIMNDSEQGAHLLEGQRHTYPPIQAFCYILRFSVTFFGVKWTPVDKLTLNLGS